MATFSDMFFDYSVDGTQYNHALSQTQTSDDLDDDLDHDEDDDRESDDVKKFWEMQQRMLREVLRRTSSMESKIRIATKEALRAIDTRSSYICDCGKQVAAVAAGAAGSGSGCCKSCLMGEVSRRLGNVGFNSAICKTKWRNCSNIPSGEHVFIDVIDDTKPNKGTPRVIIELNFRAEFEMARANDEYNRLVARLPEVFVGKVEKLSNLIKILCSAGKKSMKENKMHLGPWRKQRYMEAKWLSTFKRTTCIIQELPLMATLRKPRASMLTVDLLIDKLPNIHSTTVRVV